METNELELNRWAHELLGLCWHTPEHIQRHEAVYWVWRCSKCDRECAELRRLDNPDYCSSLDFAAKVEAKAIELVGSDKYLSSLFQVIDEIKQVGWSTIVDGITSPALTRVQAAKRAVEGK